MAGWYAQKHPDEDFAETFAVWLTPGLDWRWRYAGRPAVAKLEHVGAVAREVAEQDPPRPLARAAAELPVEEMEAFLRARQADLGKAGADRPQELARR
ncbi:MAG TPA: hypothetical protein VII08_09120 [Myxococcales bacterium]